MLFKVNNRLLYMTSKERLIAYQRVLEEAGMIAWAEPYDQMIELQPIHPEQKEKHTSTEKSCCGMISQMIHQLFSK